MVAATQGDPFMFAPGTGAFYSNLGFDLLGLALAGAGGKPYADLLAERVLRAPRHGRHRLQSRAPATPGA